MKCRVCKTTRINAKRITEHDSMCARCEYLASLEPFDLKAAEEIIRRKRRAGASWDQVVAEMRRVMVPPKDCMTVLQGHGLDWHLVDVVHIDTVRLERGKKAA